MTELKILLNPTFIIALSKQIPMRFIMSFCNGAKPSICDPNEHENEFELR